MELKIKTKFAIGDTVFWMDNDPSKWWYNHIFEGTIKSITTNGHTVSYGIDVTSAEDMLTGADESSWHKEGWRYEKEACNLFIDKAALRKSCLGDRLRHKLLSIEKEIEASTDDLKLVQEDWEFTKGNYFTTSLNSIDKNVSLLEAGGE